MTCGGVRVPRPNCGPTKSASSKAKKPPVTPAVRWVTILLPLARVGAAAGLELCSEFCLGVEAALLCCERLEDVSSDAVLVPKLAAPAELPGSAAFGAAD